MISYKKSYEVVIGNLGKLRRGSQRWNPLLSSSCSGSSWSLLLRLSRILPWYRPIRAIHGGSVGCKPIARLSWRFCGQSSWTWLCFPSFSSSVLPWAQPLLLWTPQHQTELQFQWVLPSWGARHWLQYRRWALRSAWWGVFSWSVWARCSEWWSFWRWWSQLLWCVWSWSVSW